jgi:hypothetical protein
MTTRTRPRHVPLKLMTIRQVAEEYGMPLVTAQSFARMVAREDGVVRIPGLRRVFLRRADVERRLAEGGGTSWR